MPPYRNIYEHRSVLDACFEYVNKTQNIAFTYNEVAPLLPKDLYSTVEDRKNQSRLFHKTLDLLERYGILVKIYMYERSHVIFNPRDKNVLECTNYNHTPVQLREWIYLYESTKQYKYERRSLKQMDIFTDHKE